jgi:hypothetical protein
MRLIAQNQFWTADHLARRGFPFVTRRNRQSTTCSYLVFSPDIFGLFSCAILFLQLCLHNRQMPPLMIGGAMLLIWLLPQSSKASTWLSCWKLRVFGIIGITLFPVLCTYPSNCLASFLLMRCTCGAWLGPWACP